MRWPVYALRIWIRIIKKINNKLKMIAKLTAEFKFFLSMPHNMRVLLITNMLYALVLPVVEILMAAYIMRYFADTSYVAIFQVAMYTGIIITSLTNGFLPVSYTHLRAHETDSYL